MVIIGRLSERAHDSGRTLETVVTNRGDVRSGAAHGRQDGVGDGVVAAPGDQPVVHESGHDFSFEAATSHGSSDGVTLDKVLS